MLALAAADAETVKAVFAVAMAEAISVAATAADLGAVPCLPHFVMLQVKPART